MTKKIERRDVILDAAIRIADRDGVDGVTIRRIEDETGLSAPLVYRHFRDKSEILDALLERLMRAEERPVDSALSARGWLEMTFQSLFDQASAHSALLTLLSSKDRLQHNALRMSEQVLEVLSGAGCDPARAGHAFHLLMAYTVGSVVMARGTEAKNDMLAQAIISMPHLIRSGPYLDPRSAAVFKTGLCALLDTIFEGETVRT